MPPNLLSSCVDPDPNCHFDADTDPDPDPGPSPSLYVHIGKSENFELLFTKGQTILYCFIFLSNVIGSIFLMSRQ
jgi:hypothetical protein